MTFVTTMSGWLLSLGLTVALLFLLLRPSPGSTPISPTPSMRPTPPLAPAVTVIPETTTPTPVKPSENGTSSTTQMLMHFMERLADRDRELMEKLVLGRESTPQTSEPATPLIWNENPQGFDFDTVPLAPGIEAALNREAQENEQQRLLRERAEIQDRIMEIQTTMGQQGFEDSSPGPWDASEEPPPT